LFSISSGLLRDGRVNIEDHLVDSNNRPIQASVNFEVRYSSPENMEGNFDSPNVSKYVHQQSLDDDQQMLLSIEQNIANLERTLNQGKE
jgi:otoferlin